MRKNSEESLNEIPRILNESFLSRQNLESAERNKIISLRHLQSLISTKYSTIMANLARFCEQTMGESPCAFALIGMGSLARKEITPYSDFENVIVLEINAFKNKTETEKQIVLTFFRWFSVIFQTVLINLQETIIPSVAIPCLNNFLDPAADSNWFFDAFTTRGISFDGMMPHACKFPLGRQQFTTDKPWKTELIKPVKEMLEYLNSEESLKNGYHLDDILTKTCFVYGNRKVFDDFQTRVIQKLKNEQEKSVEQSVKSQISDDLLAFATKSTLFRISLNNSLNIKRVAYRSITLFIAALGRICSSHSLSCFDIIEDLAVKGVLSKYAEHKLMYAIAIACEIRLRWYTKNKSQSDIIEKQPNEKSTLQVLCDIIGKASAVSYFQIAYALQSDISKRLGLKHLHFYSNPQLLNLSLYYCLDAQRKSKKLIQRNLTGFVMSKKLYSFDHCLNLLESSCIFSGAEQNRQHGQGIKPVEVSKQYFDLGCILLDMKAYDDAKEYFLKSLAVADSPQSPSSDIETDKILALTFLNIGRCLLGLNQLSEAMKYFHQSLEGRERASSNVEKDNNYATSLHCIAQCEYKMGRPVKALQHLQRVLQIKRNVSLDPNCDRQIASVMRDVGRCYLELNKLNEALELFDKSLAAENKVAAYIEEDITYAVTLQSIGEYLLAKQKHTHALEFFQRALQIKEAAALKSKLDMNTDLSIADTLNNIGVSKMALSMYAEAVKDLQHSLRICKNVAAEISADGDTQTTIQQLLYRIGRCFIKTNSYSEALPYFETAVKTIEHLSDVQEDSILADLLHDLGSCLANLHKPIEAKKCFEKASKIREHCFQNSVTK